MSSKRLEQSIANKINSTLAIGAAILCLGLLLIDAFFMGSDEPGAERLSVAMMLLIASVAVIVARTLHRKIVEPVAALSGSMDRFTKSQDHSIRAAKFDNDETGILVDGFNALLRQIEQRDELLTEQRNQLNSKVEQRTMELRDLNSKLQQNMQQLSSRKEEAELASLAKSEFLANMSHEIRTPINGVLGMTELMQNTPLNDKQHYFAATILSSAKSLLTIINDILDFSKIEAGSLSLEAIPFQLGDLLEDCAVILAGQAQQKELDLLVDVPADQSFAVVGDPHRLRQVVNNFLSNAIKFTEQGEIVLALRNVQRDQHTQTFVCEIRDTGIGMSPESVERIFESFSQADGSTTRLYGGTGLGLCITKQLIELMDGNINVVSTQGIGSTFSFELTLPMAHNIESTTLDRTGFENLHALIIDDNDTNSIILSQILRAWGIAFSIANNCLDATTALANDSEKRTNLVFLDQDMPATNDRSVGHWININRQELPVITLSPIGGMGCKATDLVSLAAAITKPIRHADLYAAIRAVLSVDADDDESADDFSTLQFNARHPTLNHHSRLLVAEDNLINQEVILGMLEQTQCQVQLVDNGKLAFHERFNDEYDLIIMDCQMPVLDGYAATQQIRRREQEEHLSAIPIIAVTANALKGDREKCIDAGMNDFLSKPYEQEDLYRVVTSWLPTQPVEPGDTDSDLTNREPAPVFTQEIDDGGPARRINNSVKPEALQSLRALQRHGQPDIVEKIVSSFLRNGPFSMANIQEAFIDGDAEKIHQITHSLKSTASSIGAMTLSSQLSKLDEICRQGSIAGCSALIQDIEEEMSIVCNELPGLLSANDDARFVNTNAAHSIVENAQEVADPPKRSVVTNIAKEKVALVVDDDSNMRMLTKAALNRAGFRVVEASSGEQALELFSDHRVAIVLLDVEMPGMSGFEVCQAMRDRPDGQHTAIIMMTGRDDVEAINRAYDLGATDFTSKPVRPELLCQRVLYIHRAQRAMQSVLLNEQRLASAQRVAKLGYWEWNKHQRSIYLSDELLGFFGLNRNSYDDNPESLLAMIAEEPRRLIKQMVREGSPSHNNALTEIVITQADGEQRFLQQKVEMVNNDTALLATVLDITEKKQAEGRIFDLANLDTITRLPNRNLMVSQLENLIMQYQHENKCFALITIQFCELRRVQESYGKGVVESLVKAAVARLQQDVRSSDFISSNKESGISGYDNIMHLSDDEFVVIMPQLKKPSNAAALADRLTKSLTDNYDVEAHSIYLYVKAGIVLYPENGMDPESLLRNASVALKQAKESNGGSYHFYSSEQNDKAVEILNLESELRQAMRGQPFQLYYQPKILNQSLKPYGAEALIRWMHPDRGFVSPAQFIPLAEDMGLMTDIGSWVLREAIRQLAEWQKLGLPDVIMSVNVAPQQMSTTDLPLLCSELLSEFRVKPELLELEITEGSLIEDVEHSIETLARLKNIGVSIALDDFGTGYSSLSYLKKFSLDVLKIDRSFIRDLMMEPQNAAIVESTINLAHRLGMTVVAEGVEELEHLNWLTEHACDATQGYYFSPPLNPKDFQAWFVEFNNTGRKSA